METSLSFSLSNNFERILELGQAPVRQVRTGIGTIALGSVEIQDSQPS